MSPAPHDRPALDQAGYDAPGPEEPATDAPVAGHAPALHDTVPRDRVPAEPVLVACLCAGWCGTCTTYRDTLAAVAQEHPQLQFAWIDIEDDSDALGDAALDIENFPTLMLLRGGRPLFHGTVLPHAATLKRMLEALADGSLAAGDAAQVPHAMAAAVWRLGPERPV